MPPGEMTATADDNGSAPPSWPRITLVTPVLNGVRLLETAIRSVTDQDYPNLEYIVVDGGSTDGSLELLRRQEDRIAWWTSAPDDGMYDALNKGFARATGQVFGWLSATDVLHRGALFVVGGVFRDLSQVEWITGLPTGLTEEGATYSVGPRRRWTRRRFLLGANEHIQQESTFWRRSLWDRAGGRLDASQRMASDFELWLRFFRHARLYPVEGLIGGFRHHSDSLWMTHRAECRAICERHLTSELAREPDPLLRVLGQAARWSRTRPWLGTVWRKVVHRALHALPGPDRPPMIRHDGTRWRIDL